MQQNLKHIFFFLVSLFFMPLTSFSQSPTIILSSRTEEWQYAVTDSTCLLVVASPYVNVRKGPSEDSTLIGRIPFMTEINKIKIITYWENGESFEWSRIEIDGKEGYIDKKFLRVFVRPSKLLPDCQFLNEGEAQGIINFKPELNWYGVYSIDKHNRILKKINISIEFPTKKDYEYDPDFKIVTDQKESSMLLLGSKLLLKEGVLKDSILTTDYDREKSHFEYIFPGKRMEYQLSGGTPITFIGQVDSVLVEAYGKKVFEKQYKLKMTYEKLNETPSSIRKWQVISKVIPGAEKAIFYERPKNNYFQRYYVFLHWIGDLDGDNKLDFIMDSGDNREACDQWHTSTLFLSSWAEKGNLVKNIYLGMK